MKRFARLVSILMAMALLFSTFGMIAQAEELPEITVAYFIYVTVPEDQELVEAEINKLVQEKIGAKVKLVPIPMGNYQQQLNLMLSSGEKIDLVSLQAAHMSDFAAKGQILPLNDLIQEYGSDILTVFDREFINCGEINGELYGITTNRDLALGIDFVLRQDYVDKYGIDMSQIKTLDDVEKLVFEPIHAAEPDVTLIMPVRPSQGVANNLTNNDNLGGDEYGVLLNNGAEMTVVNWFKTPEYADLVNRMRRWYTSGYIMKDVATNQDSNTTIMKAGKCISSFIPIKPGIETQFALQTGYDWAYAPIIEPYTNSTIPLKFMWGIARNSTVPEKAMQLLNLMYTDADLINLFDWGIKDKHYVETEDGHIQFPEGMDSSNSPYNLVQGWVFGNQFLSRIWVGDPLNLYEEMDVFNKSAAKSQALGFAFNGENVKTERAALQAVSAQYQIALENGVMDPETGLPEFIAALEAAGIDAYIAEKQAQLDAWLARQ